jgi:hypothetical protein
MANQHINDNEIDVTQLSKHIKLFFGRMNDAAFDAVLFVKRNIIILAILIAAGVGYGYFKDRNTHSYQNKIYVYPNFGSVDYLYEEVNHINTKIMEGDAGFLALTGIKAPGKFVSVKVEPVVDVYGFVEDNPNAFDQNTENTNFQLLKFMIEKGDINKVLKNPETARNYKKHIITITTKEETKREEIIDPILNYLNSSEYYKEIQKGWINNLTAKIAATEKSIGEIDTILGNPVAIGNANAYSGTDESGLFQLVRVKAKLVNDQGKNRINAIKYTKIIKDGAATYNIKSHNFTTGKMKFIYPVILLFIFVCVMQFISFYRSQTEKRKKIIINE